MGVQIGMQNLGMPPDLQDIWYICTDMCTSCAKISMDNHCSLWPCTDMRVHMCTCAYTYAHTHTHTHMHTIQLFSLSNNIIERCLCIISISCSAVEVGAEASGVESLQQCPSVVIQLLCLISVFWRHHLYLYTLE